MEMSIVAGFWVVSFLLIMTPGADWAYAISAGIHGRRVVPAVMGLMSGHLLATLIVVAGVGVMMAQHPLALSGLTIAGALYLLWLGISLLRAPGAPESATTSAANWKQWADTREKYRQALKRAALLEQNGAKRVTLHFSGKTAKPRQEA